MAFLFAQTKKSDRISFVYCSKVSFIFIIPFIEIRNKVHTINLKMTEFDL